MDPPPIEFFNNPPARAVNRLLNIADAPAPTVNIPADDPDRFIRRAASSVKDSTAYPKWKKAFEDLANDGPAFAVLLEDLDKWLTTVQDHSSPSSQKKRAAMEYKWSTFIRTIEPGIDDEHIWHSDVILKHCDKFPYILVSLSFLFFCFFFDTNVVRIILLMAPEAAKTSRRAPFKSI